MTITQLYDKLTNISLFKGVSGEDLALIADRVNLRWLHIGQDQPFIQANEPCQHLAILTEGKLLRSTDYDNGTYNVKDLVSEVCIIEPEQLYGLTCRYRSSYRTYTSCKVLIISKNDIRQTLMNIPVFRINLLNMLSARYNKLLAASEQKPYDLKEMIMHFGAEKPLSIHIKMADMGRYLGAARRTISNVLHELESEGKVTLHPNLIEFNINEEVRAMTKQQN